MILRFPGVEVEVTSPDYSELAFLFGPHVVRTRDSASAVSVRVEFILPEQQPAGGNAPVEPEFLVRHGDGTPLLRRAFRGWSTMPPAIPPFAVLQERYALLQAVVLAKHGASVALVGGPYSEKLSVAAALAHRSWRFVSGQLLVLDRASGQVLPCLLPLEARGRAAVRMRTAGLPEEGHRSVSTLAGGTALLVRPECLGDVVPIHARIAMPSLVRLCGSADEGVRLAPWGFAPQVWPVDAAAAFAAAPRYRLELSSANGAEEAAGLIDAELAGTARNRVTTPKHAEHGPRDERGAHAERGARDERGSWNENENETERQDERELRNEQDDRDGRDDVCLDEPVTGQAAPAGLTASLLI